MKNGKHLGGFKYRNRRTINNLGKNSILGAIVTTIAGSIVKDLTSDNSKIAGFFNKILHPSQIENKTKNKKVIDADYSVINENLTENKTKKIVQN